MMVEWGDGVSLGSLEFVEICGEDLVGFADLFFYWIFLPLEIFGNIFGVFVEKDFCFGDVLKRKIGEGRNGFHMKNFSRIGEFVVKN